MFKLFKYQIISFLVVYLISCAASAKTLGSEIKGDSWVLPLLEGYSATLSDGVYHIYRSDSKGALQLSSRVANENISDSEFLSIVNMQVEDRAEIKNIAKGNIRGYSAMFREGPVVWSYWFFVIDRSLLFITYNVKGNLFNRSELLDALKMIDGLSPTE